ncbi:ATP-binding protein [Candidatus Gracilibacteria bacterium]|nr:ATP-binding protein [Candidatus Gracilibacteria bacterium]
MHDKEEQYILNSRELFYWGEKFGENELKKLLVDKHSYLEEHDVCILEKKDNLSVEEKNILKKDLLEHKSIIIDLWFYSKEVKDFCKELDINKDEKIQYGLFFGERIYDFLFSGIDKIREQHFLTTKFFDYIKSKNIELEDLLKMVVYLKGAILDYIKFDTPKHVNFINSIFDDISILLSKNYNDTIIKLLNEHKLAIDHSNIISKTDINGNIVYVNDEFCRLSGYTSDELIGKSHNIIRHPDTPKETFKELWDTIQSKNVWKGNIKNKKKNGDAYWVKSTIVPILDENNNILEYIAIRTDITELELAREDLKESFEKLKELDTKKDEFLNIASHELRTPMTSVKGYISMILDGDAGEINDEVRQYLSQVYKSSSRLLNLINDMLDISKIESGKQEFILEKIDVKKMLDDVSFEFEQLFKKKGQKFIKEIDFEKFEFITDLNKLKQVIINILGNANKFTPDGGEIYLKAEILDTNELEIKIKDSGIGIDKASLGVIFEKFGQVKNSLTRDINGTGLGLPIAKTIVEKLGGKITVESEVGRGTTFTITLPTI